MATTSPITVTVDSKVTIRYVNSEAYVLLLLRSPTAQTHPLEWGNPAGHIDPGETPLVTARRELAEETGLRVATASLTPIGVERFDEGYNQYEINLFATLLNRGRKPDIRISDEHLAFGFFKYRTVRRTPGIVPMTAYIYKKWQSALDKLVYA